MIHVHIIWLRTSYVWPFRAVQACGYTREYMRFCLLINTYVYVNSGNIKQQLWLISHPETAWFSVIIWSMQLCSVQMATVSYM